MKKGFNIRTIFSFGMYENYEVGIVYIFNPSYVEWCINNVEYFYIKDINDLIKCNVINKKKAWRKLRDGGNIIQVDINTFMSFDELSNKLIIGNKKYEFSKNTLELNKRKYNIYLDIQEYHRYESKNNMKNNMNKNIRLEDMFDFDNDYESQMLFGQKKGLCSDYDNECSSCPHGSRCF